MSEGDRSEMQDRVSVNRRIDASADELFRLLSDPSTHVDIDGSGMLQVAADAAPLTHVGQTFEIDMDRRPQRTTENTETYLNLVRDVPDYQVTCTVTRLVPDRLIEWSVQAVGKPPAGHVWGWRILPREDGQCLVTNYCDFTYVAAELRAKFHWPVVPVDRFARSLENLERLATRPRDTRAELHAARNPGRAPERGARPPSS